MKSTPNRGLAVLAVVVFVAGTAVATNFALRWTGHGVNFSVPEPVSLALAGAGLVWLSQSLVRRFGKA
jgi:ribose 1,5-bisphosphokinase PhnN